MTLAKSISKRPVCTPGRVSLITISLIVTWSTAKPTIYIATCVRTLIYRCITMRSLRTYMITSRIVIGHTSLETITHYIGSPGSIGICIPSMIIMCLRTMLTKMCASLLETPIIRPPDIEISVGLSLLIRTC